MTNKSVVVLAFDPGQTTGWVTLWALLSEVRLTGHGELDHWRYADGLIELCLPDYVIIENYRLFPHMLRVMTNQMIVGAEVKGGLIALTEHKNFVLDEGGGLIIQEPSERLHGARRVDVPDFMQKGLTDHEKSAFHHALTFLVKRHFTSEELNELSWHRQE